MANAFIKPTVVAQAVLETLYADTIMLPLISREWETDLQENGIGDTVTYRKPAVLAANVYNQAVGITRQDVTETSDTIQLDTLLDTSVGVTSYDMTLNIRDFQRQVVKPAVTALVQGIDTAIITKMAAASWANTIVASPYNATSNPRPTMELLRAGRALDTKLVPSDDRVAVVDPYIYTQWKMDELTLAAEKRADQGTALRNAEIGEIHNFDTFKSNNIRGANSFKGWAFHPSAVALVSKPLALPDGPAFKGRASAYGLTVRVVKDYDITYKTDILSIDVLFGVKVVDVNRGVYINGNADS